MTNSRFLIDAGGTNTRVRVLGSRGDRSARIAASVNPSVGLTTCEEHRIVSLLRRMLEPGVSRGVIGSASVSPGTLAREKEFWSNLLGGLGVSGRILLTNDVYPLVTQGESAHAQIGIVMGTGSCFLTQQSGVFSRFGGREWLASDEGGATHLGWLGLRSLVKALDGRRPMTVFHQQLVSLAGYPDAETLVRAAAELAHPKPLLASLAPQVLNAAFDLKDDSAREVVDEALKAIEEYLHFVRLNVSGDAIVRLTGGLLTNEGYRASLVGLLEQWLPGARVSIVADVTDLGHSIDWNVALLATGYAAVLDLPSGGAS